jgi:hypothetical protein
MLLEDESKELIKVLMKSQYVKEDDSNNNQ